MAQERLQKILARAGISSRRAAEQLITSGHVHVNGKPVRELGTRADPERDRIEVDGRPIARERHVYYLIHKPRGIVTTLNDPEGRPSLDELLRDVPERVYPVGRLDFHTSGALLLTNDGDLAQALLHPSHAVPKTYVAKLSREIDDYMLHALQSGVVLDDGYKTQPAHVQHLRDEDGKSWLEITITEGKNRQIHRMVESLDTRVMRLSRLSFAGLSTDGLRPGAIRPLSREEIAMLARQYLPREQAEARSVEDRDERALALRPKRTRKGEGRGGPRASANEGRRGPREYDGRTGARASVSVGREPSGERRAYGSERGQRAHSSQSPGAQRAHSAERRGAQQRAYAPEVRGGRAERGAKPAGDRGKPTTGARNDTRTRGAATDERDQRGRGRKLEKAPDSRTAEPRSGAGKQRPRAQHDGESRAAEARRANSDRPNAQRVSHDRSSTKKTAAAKSEQGARTNARSARPHKQKSSAGVDSSKTSRHKSRPT